jgi:AmpD protein
MPYESCQYKVLIGVIHSFFEHYPWLSARDIVGHCDIAPGRKTDPGTAFDWLRLYDGLCAPSGN